MDIFGFQFSYAPTVLSGVGAFAIFAMLVATGGFVFAYLTGILVSIRAIALRERNRELAKKRKLRDLLAMKAAQDELDIEIAREMHGIRPTSSFVESGELNNIDPEVVPAVLAGSGIAQAVFQTNDTALPVEEAIVSVEANTSSSEAISNEISSETPLAFAEPEPDHNTVSGIAETGNVSDTESVLASSPFGSSVPFMAEVEAESPIPVAAEATESNESVPSPFSFFSQTAENQSSESAVTETPAKPELEVSPEPTGESSPFVFSFATEPEQPEKASKPVEKPKENAKTEPVPEMSAFFQT